MHACMPSTLEAETEESRAQDQPGVHTDPLSLKAVIFFVEVCVVQK